jgi:hypothetical protein
MTYHLQHLLIGLSKRNSSRKILDSTIKASLATLRTLAPVSDTAATAQGLLHYF